jgi:hypothetical protein
MSHPGPDLSETTLDGRYRSKLSNEHIKSESALVALEISCSLLCSHCFTEFYKVLHSFAHLIIAVLSVEPVILDALCDEPS